MNMHVRQKAWVPSEELVVSNVLAAAEIELVVRFRLLQCTSTQEQA